MLTLDEIKEYLDKINKIKGLKLVGSVYREDKNTYTDIDFVTTKDLSTIKNQLLKIFPFADVMKNGSKYLQISIYGNIFNEHNALLNIDVWKAENNNELANMLTMRRLEKGEAIFYKKKAKEKGYKLSDYYLLDNKDNKIYIKSHNQLRKLLKNDS